MVFYCAAKAALITQGVNKEHPGASDTRTPAVSPLGRVDCGVDSLWIGLASQRSCQILSDWHLGNWEGRVCCAL